MEPQRVRHGLATKPPPPLEELKQTVNLPNHQRGKHMYTNAKIQEVGKQSITLVRYDIKQVYIYERHIHNKFTQNVWVKQKQGNANKRKAGVLTLISSKIEFKQKILIQEVLWKVMWSCLAASLAPSFQNLRNKSLRSSNW